MQDTHALVATMQQRIATLIQQRKQNPERSAYYTRRINTAQALLAKYQALTN
jgi:hypothetical protein